MTEQNRAYAERYWYMALRRAGPKGDGTGMPLDRCDIIDRELSPYIGPIGSVATEAEAAEVCARLNSHESDFKEWLAARLADYGVQP